MNYSFRKATASEIPAIWDILQQAITRRKEDGSEQWQDGYPNPEVVKKDINAGHGFVLTEEENIIGYTAILINDEPEYAKIIGKWLTNDDFVVFHRVAISENYLGKGLAKKMLECIEDFAITNNIYSVKSDTNFDNAAMLKIFEKSGYKYCGKVYFRGGERRAFEKVLPKTN
ncbi:GNAT family N-acetyltransferase [Flavobacterium aestuarii]|uniref:GNAT family N-acetyltransferase n=1 Tax=Flavobacterium aestuarii TaxID=3149227 RepID=UPI0032B3BBE1